MNITPIDTAPLLTSVGQTGPLFAFMMLVILALFGIAIYLYRDGRDANKQYSEDSKAINTTLAGLKEIIGVIIHKKD